MKEIMKPAVFSGRMKLFIDVQFVAYVDVNEKNHIKLIFYHAITCYVTTRQDTFGVECRTNFRFASQGQGLLRFSMLNSPSTFPLAISTPEMDHTATIASYRLQSQTPYRSLGGSFISEFVFLKDERKLQVLKPLLDALFLLSIRTSPLFNLIISINLKQFLFYLFIVRGF